MLNNNLDTSLVSQKDNLSFIEKIRETEHSRQVDLNYLKLLDLPYIIRIAIYLRVSSPGQAKKDKVSLQEQESVIKQMVKIHPDWEIVAIYNEGGESGKEMETREKFEEMVKDAKLGKFDLIIAWSTDRLARNTIEMQNCRNEMRKYGIQITSVLEPLSIVDPRKLTEKVKPQDRMMSFFVDLKAEADNETRSERFSMGKIGKAKKGINPCKVGYGYRKIVRYENGDPNKKIEIDVVIEEEAVIVKEIYFIYDTKGWGFRRIADYFNLKGIPSPKGGLWSYSTIKYILQNPTYTGLVRWGWRLSQSKASRTRLRQGHEGIIVQGQHKPIIEPELFQRVQDKIIIRAKLGGRAVASKGLLSGLIFCGRCGGHGYLWSSKPTNKNPSGAAYLCGNYSQHGTSVCPSRYLISKIKVEEAVVQKIKKLASNPEAQDEFIKQSKSSKTKDIKLQIKNIKKSIEENIQKKERIKNLLINQDFNEKSVIEFKDEMTKCDLQQMAQENNLEKLEKELTGEMETEKMTKETILSLMDFDRIWENSELERKKMLLATIIKKVVISGDKKIYIEFNH